LDSPTQFEDAARIESCLWNHLPEEITFISSTSGERNGFSHPEPRCNIVKTDCRKRKASECTDKKEKRRKTKWNAEPYFSQMNAALQLVRLDKVSTTAVSESTGIPTRTLRRYVNYSKNPNSLFFIEEPEEEECDDAIVSWKPQTTVPMFKLLDAVNVDARVPGGDSDLTSDDVGTSPSSSCNDVNNLTAEIVPLVPNDVFHLDAPSPHFGADFGADFDDLFKDFANDDMFKDLF